MKRVDITVVDDLDGATPAEETITFGLDGRSYEIDLSSENAEQFRHDMAKWVAAARSIPANKTVSADEHVDAAAVRQWARSQGQQLSERGRLPKGLISDYLAATKEQRKHT